MRLNLVAIALIVALSVAWAETNGQAAVLKLVLRGGDQPGSTIENQGSPKKLEEGVTCIGGIPKDCYSKTTVPAGNSKCAKTGSGELTVKKVTVYAVGPQKCKGKLPAGFGADKLELKNVQCECPHLGACFNMKMEWNKQTRKKEEKKVMVQMDSVSAATIGGKKGSLDKNFQYDCYVAALQQVMDRKELEASAKEQKKAYQLVPPVTSLLLRVIASLAGLLQQEIEKSLERMTRTTSLLASDAEEGLKI